MRLENVAIIITRCIATP